MVEHTLGKGEVMSSNLITGLRFGVLANDKILVLPTYYPHKCRGNPPCYDPNVFMAGQVALNPKLDPPSQAWHYQHLSLTQA